MRPFTSQLARIALAAIAVSTNTAYGALYNDASQLPNLKYDFVVIGAGAAGNVIAARLTENPKFSVLLIEAGISDQDVLGIEVPFLAPANLPNSSVTWNYTTTPQTSLNNRALAYSRGRVLGGSTSINLMTYTRGSDDEYDRWAELTGDDSWAWKNLEPFYLKSSRLVPPVDHHSTKGLVDPAVHGFGPVEVSLPGLPTELDGRVVNTSKALGAEFPFNIDIQSGDSVGVGIAQSTIGGGIRSSSSRAYLQPNVNRRNLHVLIENTVTRLVRSGPSHGVPVFKQVEFAPGPSAKRTIVTADKEVILSAGSIGTPQILMLSGIGDSLELKRLGIKPIVNLPDVGQNLQDHPIMSNYWVVNSNNTFDDVLRNTSILNADLAQWNTSKTGLFGNAPANAVALLRIPDDASIFKRVRDPAAGRRSAHFEMIFADGFAATVIPQPATGHFVTINTAVVSPTSVGSVRLASADPFAFPLIDPNFFSTSFDQFAMLSAVKAARAFMAAPPWRGFVVSRFGPVGTAETDEEIIAAARDAIVTIWHPTSTARMSPKHAPWGVVDPQLLVKGASGLRIVDASVMPIIPSAHTSGPTYILAERAAEFIKETWC
ncbi:GMC oxidoreductase [Trametes coccinea BRFM310]|uniref:GMC oxidoreductase n=1 Tax=Trametes coccinea (strain BRFM310) TaxID=1353009 RepID=A0A1Y2IIF0_TRAC3|nr:GMC oxidoreductase [Trametes coccinea BRFM310]